VWFVLHKRARPASRELSPLTAAQRALAAELQRDVIALCANGPRNHWSIDSLTAAAAYVEQSFQAAGYTVERQVYAEHIGGVNLIVEIAGTSKDNVVIGAHYDSVYDSPGADDNASGVAGLLALARRFAGTKPKKTLRFVAFANEEPPHFQSPAMGSLAYAKRCRDRGERIAAMLSLEMLGYYDPRRGAQQYPPALSPFFPDTGDFIAFAGNLGSRGLVKQCANAFRAHGAMHAESAALPELIPQTGWSDQWSFWQFGWKAIMVTDTALFRNPHYHTAHDTPETLDYERMARVVEGLEAVIRELVHPVSS
jgi:Zn-dependent M28 family amino/carboxypeptidase